MDIVLNGAFFLKPLCCKDRAIFAYLLCLLSKYAMKLVAKQNSYWLEPPYCLGGLNVSHWKCWMCLMTKWCICSLYSTNIPSYGIRNAVMYSVCPFPSELFGRVNTGINFDNYDSIPVEMSGENCPPPIAGFHECNFAPMLQENVKVMLNVVMLFCSWLWCTRMCIITQACMYQQWNKFYWTTVTLFCFWLILNVSKLMRFV